jgi:hypothetical protein
VVALCLAAWTSLALMLPGEALASAGMPGGAHAAQHLPAAHASHHPAAAADAHPMAECAHHAPGAPHAHHSVCLDCCCAAPVGGLPAGAAALATPSVATPPVPPARRDNAPRASAAFLHPFPNGPPQLRA